MLFLDCGLAKEHVFQASTRRPIVGIRRMGSNELCGVEIRGGDCDAKKTQYEPPAYVLTAQLQTPVGLFDATKIGLGQHRGPQRAFQGGLYDCWPETCCHGREGACGQETPTSCAAPTANHAANAAIFAVTATLTTADAAEPSLCSGSGIARFRCT